MSGSRVRILSAAVPLLVMVSLSPALAADPPAAAPAAAPDTTRFVLKPSITLSDVGLDTNILTTARDQKRDTSSLATWMRSALTPLTTVAVIVDTEREHFDFMPERDATSVKAVGGLEFKPAALVDGKVFAGYRAFRSVGDDDSNGRGFAG